MPIWQYPFGTERKLARNRRFLLDTFFGGGSMFNLGSESLKKPQTICKNVPPKGSQTRSLTSSGNTSAWREPRPQVFLMDLVHLFQDFQWDSKASGLQSITLQAGSKAPGPQLEVWWFKSRIEATTLWIPRDKDHHVNHVLAALVRHHALLVTVTDAMHKKMLIKSRI